jgi:ABC-2 type transport system ATP-binding protein
MDALIKTEGLFRYYGRHCAVRDLSFELRRGEVLGFLGPNGAGKSTTMRILSGELAPSSGSVSLNGIDLLKHPLRAKASLGYLPEQPPLYNDLTVDEYLRFCARLRRVAGTKTAAAVDRAKQRCGLQSMGGRLINTLSKGYRQRVGIAQAVIHEPDVIILDEPTSGLDPNQIQEIRALIRELGEEHGVILSTHILPEVESICSRVLILNQGNPVFSQSLQELRQQSAGKLIIDLGQAPERDDLADLPGVTGVDPLGEGRFRLHLAENAEPGVISERIVRHGWILRELAPERHDLEQIFTQLTSEEA